MAKEKEEVVVEEKTKEVKASKQKRGVIRTIISAILSIIILLLIANTIIGVINFNRLNNDQELILFTAVEEATEDGVTTELYRQGAFNLIKTTDDKEISVVLRPFFMTK